MHKTINQEWVSLMAKELLSEIMHQMCGIVLTEVSDKAIQEKGKQLDSVCGETTGDFIIRMRLEAERELFARLASNMIGAQAKDQMEIEEYATEFFNICCGRFVSELYNKTGQSARFLPTMYESPSDKVQQVSGNQVNTITFVSDKGEKTVFSWTLASQRI